MEDNTVKNSIDSDAVFVSSRTNTKGLATCIFASATKEGKEQLKLRGIGAGANNQMTKAVIIAKGKLSEKGVSISIDMYFKDIPSRDEAEDSITAIEYLLTFN